MPGGASRFVRCICLWMHLYHDTAPDYFHALRMISVVILENINENYKFFSFS